MVILNTRTLLFYCTFVFLSIAAVMPVTGQEKQQWKVGTLTPKGVGWAKQFEEIMLPGINEATGGNLDVKVYWGGIMGDDEDIIAKMRVGQLQAAGLTGQGATILCPEFSVIELPFLFESYAEVDHVRKKMWSVFDRYCQQRGFKLLLWLDQDFDQIYSVKWDFREIADFKKARFMTWYGPLEESLLKRLGSSPIPVDIPELVPTLRQGVADSLIAPGLWMIATQLYPAVDYMVPLKIRYSPAIVVCTLEAWNNLPADYRQGLVDVAPGIVDRFTAATRKDNRRALDAMAAYGLERVELPEKTVETIQTAASQVWTDQTGNLYPAELLEEVRGHLADYRKKGP